MKELINCIAPAFYEVHWKIKEREFVHYWEKGGRGSTKSSFVSIEFINALIQNPLMHGIALRKYKDNLRDSVFNQLIWAINELGLNEYFTWTYSPLKITYYTGQQIFFRGCDDPTKIKSIKTDFGYIGLGWFEELNEFSGMEEVRNVSQSFIRGGDDFLVFYSYNPPPDKNNWVNEESETTVSNRNVHHSTYLDVSPEWIGSQFIKEAELIKELKPKKYEHEYLGIANGSNDNTVTKYFTDDNVKEINYCKDVDLYISCDFNVDPMSWVLAHLTYKQNKDASYILDKNKQKILDKVFFFDEIIIENTNTRDTALEFLDRYGEHEADIFICGDASGDYRRAENNQTNYRQIKNILRKHFEGKRLQIKTKLRASNPPIKNRIEAWNQKILSNEGKREIIISPNCVRLLQNIKQLVRKPGTSLIDLPTTSQIKQNPEMKFLGHPFDAASYIVEYFFPIKTD